MSDLVGGQKTKLAEIRKKMGFKTTFGIGMVPLKNGTISVSDWLTNIKKANEPQFDKDV